MEFFVLRYFSTVSPLRHRNLACLAVITKRETVILAKVVMGQSLLRLGLAFFGGLGLDILRRAQARSRLGLDSLRRAQKIGAFIE